MSFVRGCNPIWLMVDLEGKILDDTYYIFYLTNTLPYLPQLVYRDNQGLIPWTDPIEFLSNGTLPDNIYFNPDLVYRLEVRHGPTQDDALIYEVNDYVPGNGGAPIPSDTGAQENQVSNPQFSQVSFGTIPPASTPTLVLTVAGTYEIAPDWFITLTGIGTCTITQLIFNGTQDIASSPVPPYALRVATSGWSSAILYQRFNGNGAIWANTFVSMSLLARSSNSVANPITLVYSPNTPGTPITITTAPLNVGTYQIIQGVIALPQSTNSTLNNAAYVDMQIVLPGTGSIDLSNVQVMGQSEMLPIDFAQLPEETIERQIDHLFNFYKPELFYKQIPSYLVGWDFALNPSQFFGPTVTPQAVGANKSYYAWDQTIIFQSANSAVTVTQGASGDIVLTAATSTQLAMIQYLDQDQIRKLTRQKIATNILAYTNKTGGLKVTVTLYVTTAGSLPNINAGTNNSLVATLDANGKPATFNDSWVEIPRDLKQNATFTIAQATDLEFTDYMFNGWDLNSIASSNALTFFAIVIGTAPMVSTDALHIQSVGLMAGDIATRPAPQTFDEVFRQCQYFYEKSYPITVPAGSVSNPGLRAFTFLNSGDPSGMFFNMYNQTFGLVYQTTKRVNPKVTFWTPAGLVNNIQVGMISGNTYLTPDNNLKTNPNVEPISNYSIGTQSTESLIMFPINLRTIFSFAATSFTGTTFTLQGLILYHYVLDARLGII